MVQGSEDDRGLAGIEESQRGQVAERGAVIAQVVLRGPDSPGLLDSTRCWIPFARAI
ncbi:hypothetical protein [Candidatus Mycobacterium methanotrophicum]|uniref:hypothetical protein n=1 Tax=Candidatus Mycobacterium methanotrophicum TaxID=2943498 RepID=UPI001C577857|nr:hypothetical protein [Candidatus Mycobacterium methanotrophicum]